MPIIIKRGFGFPSFWLKFAFFVASRASEIGSFSSPDLSGGDRLLVLPRVGSGGGFFFSVCLTPAVVTIDYPVAMPF